MHYLFCWQQIIILCHHCYDLLHHFLFKLQAFASLLPSQHFSVPSVVEVDESLLPNLQVCPEGFVCYCQSTCNHGHVTW